MSPLSERVAGLVRAVDARWRAERYALAPFPELAARALREAGPFTGMSAADVAEDVAVDPGLGAGVGEAPEDSLPLYEGPRFTVALRVLVEGHAQPKDHPWSGAYQAVASGAWRALYAFDGAVLHDPSFELGELRRTHVERLAPGQVAPVAAAPRTIHAVVHVDRPALALIVRTSESLGVLGSTYLAPGIRISSAPPPPNTLHRLRALDALRTVDRRQWLDLLRASLAGDSDARTAFDLLRYAHERVGASPDERDAVHGLAGAAERWFGPHTDTVRRALARLAAQQAVTERVLAADTHAERLACAAAHLGQDAADAASMLAALSADAPADP